jgi:hypothetical protein
MAPLRRMRRHVFLAALVSALVLAAAPARAADPIFPTNSRIGLVPPPGFTPSAKFIGFENPDASAAILVVELPADAYADLEKGFTNEVLKARGMTVNTREPVTLRDGRGIFIAGQKEAEGIKRYEGVLIAGISDLTAVVSVQMIEASRTVITDAAMRDAFKTVAVRAQIPDSEKLSVLPYKFGNLAGFRVVRTAQNGTAILTQGSNDAVADVAQPFMLIGVAGGEAPKPEERDAFARRVFSSAPGIKDIRILRAEPMRIGQMAGYEIVAEARDARSNVDVTTVQWLRFGQAGYLQIFAIARRGAWDEVFPRLRTIRDGIELNR